MSSTKFYSKSNSDLAKQGPLIGKLQQAFGYIQEVADKAQGQAQRLHASCSTASATLEVICHVRWEPQAKTVVLVFEGSPENLQSYQVTNPVTQSPSFLLPHVPSAEVYKPFAVLCDGLISPPSGTTPLLQIIANMSGAVLPRRVICTGYCIGGSVATVAAPFLALSYPSADVRCITFGAPRVGNRSFVQLVGWLCEYSYRVANWDDLIPDHLIGDTSNGSTVLHHVEYSIMFGKKDITHAETKHTLRDKLRPKKVVNTMELSTAHHSLCDYAQQLNAAVFSRREITSSTFDKFLQSIPLGKLLGGAPIRAGQQVHWNSQDDNAHAVQQEMAAEHQTTSCTNAALEKEEQLANALQNKCEKEDHDVVVGAKLTVDVTNLATATSTEYIATRCLDKMGSMGAFHDKHVSFPSPQLTTTTQPDSGNGERVANHAQTGVETGPECAQSGGETRPEDGVGIDVGISGRKLDRQATSDALQREFWEGADDLAMEMRHMGMYEDSSLDDDVDLTDEDTAESSSSGATGWKLGSSTPQRTTHGQEQHYIAQSILRGKVRQALFVSKGAYYQDLPRFSRCTGIKDAVLLTDESYDANLWVGWHDGTLILSSRGTVSLKATLQNLRFLSRQMDFLPYFPDARVHMGILDTVLAVTVGPPSKLMEAARKVVPYGCSPGRVLVTGHSLGAGVAQVVALWASLTYPLADVRCITFGAPRVGNRYYKEAFSLLVGNGVRVVNKRDCMINLPPSFRNAHYVHVDSMLWLCKGKARLGKRPTKYEFQQHNFDHYLWAYFKAFRHLVPMPLGLQDFDEICPPKEPAPVEHA